MDVGTARELRSARQAVTLSAAQKQHRCDAARWALAHGQPLQLDAITVIIAAKHDQAVMDDGHFGRWTSSRLLGFLWGFASEWCAMHAVVVPDALSESLWTYLSYLAEERLLAPGSSQIGALRAVLVESGGLTRAGRRKARTRPGELRQLRRSG